MEVLVTGATGCLGRNLVDRLSVDGKCRITAVGRNRSIGALLVKKNVQFVAADLTDLPSIQTLVKGKQGVIHCAALTSPWGKRDDFYSSNVIGTDNIVSASLDAGIKRFVHVSTPSIYHDGNPRESISEADRLPTKHLTHYAATKLLAEQIVDQAYKKGLPTITIRPRAIFGPHDQAILPRLLRVARRGWFPLIGNGSAKVDITFVSNVVDALVLCLNSDDSNLGRKYNITNGEPMFVKDLLAQVFDALGVEVRFRPISYKAAYALATIIECAHRIPPLSMREPEVTRYSIDLLGVSQTLDISAARRDLRYSPKISIVDGLKEIRRWMGGG